MPNQPQAPPADAGDGTCQLKAGHPPAVKVGSMRVTQRTHSTSSTHSNKSEDDKPTPAACSFAPKTVIQTTNDGVSDSPALQQSAPEAVKAFHEKPQATHDYRNNSNNSHKTNFIQQPKK